MKFKHIQVYKAKPFSSFTFQRLDGPVTAFCPFPAGEWLCAADCHQEDVRERMEGGQSEVAGRSSASPEATFKFKLNSRDAVLNLLLTASMTLPRLAAARECCCDPLGRANDDWLPEPII